MGRPSSRPYAPRTGSPLGLNRPGSMLKRKDKSRSPASDRADLARDPGKGLIVFRFNGKDVISKPGCTIEEGLRNARQGFPDLEGIPVSWVTFSTGTELRGPDEKVLGHNVADVSPVAWFQHMSQCPAYAVVNIAITYPRITLRDSDGHHASPQFADVDVQQALFEKENSSIAFPSIPAPDLTYSEPLPPYLTSSSSPPRSRTNSDASMSDQTSEASVRSGHSFSSFKSKAKNAFGL
ncbi:hypothetical protein EIP91_001250 [Steccherinum ochraceum]|uniref:Uncharacterized protein n=1 Tax=Steccherinum ochraceum TaxID=92696 RepID=A0A4R0REB9_9APHY|nr:hypothetical protein EIP91_001250 [Steccherinum ochraceum]